MNVDFVFNSGSVTPGHPDKLCDSISDAIVDGLLQQDPAARIAAECAIASSVLFVSLFSNTIASLDVAGVARKLVAAAGYRGGEFDADECSVMINQSTLPDYLAPRVDLADADDDAVERVPAQNPVTLFGYACRQADNLMPLPITLAHRLARRLAAERGALDYLIPDGQAQVGIAYRGRQPVAVHSVTLVAAQRAAGEPPPAKLRDALLERVVMPVLAEVGLPEQDGMRLAVNPSGAVIAGGPLAHSGLTGRKTGIDAYGDYARASGSALSGKDPLRVDRIGAYAARHAAKTIVAAGLADECELQLSYAVGLAEPVSLRVLTYGSGRLNDDVIAQRIRRVFDFRPGRIARDYGLQRLPADNGGFYQQLAVYGQVGREDVDAPWERLDRVEALRD